VNVDDRIERLTAIRDRLTASMEDAVPREIPAIARELRATLDVLDQLGLGHEQSEVDDLTVKRQERRQAAAG
jgi:hypothetical protein